MSKSVNHLPVLNARFGVSCECRNAAQLGAALAYLAVIGCENIGWQRLREPEPEEKTARAPGRRSKKTGRPRKSARDRAEAFVARNAAFTVDSLAGWLARHGHSRQRAHATLHAMKREKKVRSVGRGKYERVNLRLASAA